MNNCINILQGWMWWFKKNLPAQFSVWKNSYDLFVSWIGLKEYLQDLINMILNRISINNFLNVISEKETNARKIGILNFYEFSDVRFNLTSRELNLSNESLKWNSSLLDT